MYIPSYFRETDLTRLDWLAANDAFGTLISVLGAAPFATHLPVLYRREADQVKLTGHWARANPQWQSIEGQRVLFIFHGPHGYISPRWYTEPQNNVPTWNYATAHLYGEIRLVQEPDKLRGIVTALADQYERHAQSPWRLADAHGQDQLRGIVGFELVVQSIELKFKLNQNHIAANVAGAIAGLRSEGSGRDAIAQLMEDALARRAAP
ncbi:MAG TPA: FMN-binding negative transcriptional regulator [Steroidobacteraceae bacterium]